MRLFYFLFFLWLNLDESLQQTSKNQQNVTYLKLKMVMCLEILKSTMNTKSWILGAIVSINALKTDLQNAQNSEQEQSTYLHTPVCEEIKCRLTLPPLEGTRYEPGFRNLFSPGETLRVICGERFWISNRRNTSAVTTCKDDGEWTVRPLCQEVMCSNRRQPNVYRWSVHWNEQLTLGRTVSYSCNQGYKKTDRATVATCTRDEWSPKPLCTEITCARRDYPDADITTNNKEIYKYYEHVNYVCKEGYQGSFTLTCVESGWRGQPQCTVSFSFLVGCETPPLLADGDIKYTIKDHYSHNEIVEYVCQKYYTMEGNPNKTCINGEWTGHMRCLKPCIVNEDTIRQQNITLKSSLDNKYFAHDEMIEFGCTRGIPVGAVAMRQRCNGGVLLLPTCQ
ncbi:complement factor H-related protein 2-like [Pempheris klunzingeri]|uniref:complement factor H-related protein 2-like n=1 Tax=Pempheris klunzingeri TaxID=3127111 RepID=UPI00397F7213